MKQADFDKWLATVPCIVYPTDEQIELIKGLVGTPALTALFGLLFGERQGFYAFLSNLPLGGADQDCAASVIQGKIRGIEKAITTVQDIAVSDEADEGSKS